MINKLKNVWYNMRKRCYSKTYRDYDYYGANYDRIKYLNWSIDKALTTPIREKEVR